MFNTMTFGQKYSSKEYKKIENTLRVKLFQLQQQCKEHNLAVLITIAGVDGSGRGAILNLLSSWLDAKKLSNHTFWYKTDEEILRPESWRYWVKLPKHGEFGIFVGGWYGEPIRKASYGDIGEDEFYRTMAEKVEFERTLADNDYIVAKLWLHLGEEEHAKRREARKKEKGTFHFTPYEKESEKNYKSLISSVSKAITITDKDFAPWFIIDAYDKEFRNVAIARYLISTIEHAIAQKTQKDAQKAPPLVENTPANLSVLDQIDLTQSIAKKEYSAELKELQNEIYQLTYKAFRQGISSTLVFEGADAAGKGGAIRRLASAVDSRITRIIPISSPTDEELSHHYLWRFWRHVPMAGYVTIYDRSWYGRVLVERVEGFAKPEDWKRAYSEINSFEEQLVEHKNILIKFWLHISSEEQLRRFKEREETPWKTYKITDEDWRNRDKALAYKVAADEMFMRTNTDHAPWHIVPAESKYVARLAVLTHYKEALQKALLEADKHAATLSVKDLMKKEKKAKT